MKTRKVALALTAAGLMLIPAAAASAAPLPASPLATTVNDACSGTQVNTISDVNLRTKASATSPTAGVITKGTTLNVMDCTGGRYWWHVNLGGASGFVSSRYTVELGNVDVSTGPIQIPQPEPVCEQVPIWTTQAVNLRAAASATSKVKTVLPGGAKVTVLDCQGGSSWKHVAYNGMQGFVSARYTVQQLSE